MIILGKWKEARDSYDDWANVAMERTKDNVERVSFFLVNEKSYYDTSRSICQRLLMDTKDVLYQCR